MSCAAHTRDHAWLLLPCLSCLVHICLTASSCHDNVPCPCVWVCMPCRLDLCDSNLSLSLPLTMIYLSLLFSLALLAFHSANAISRALAPTARDLWMPGSRRHWLWSPVHLGCAVTCAVWCCLQLALYSMHCGCDSVCCGVLIEPCVALCYAACCAVLRYVLTAL